MTIPQSLKGWTIVRSDGTVVTQTAVPFERLQVTDAAGLVSAFNRFVDRTIAATLGARSVPFGAGGTVLLDVPGVSGKTLHLPHRLGTANLSAIWGAPSKGSLPVTLVTFDDASVNIQCGSDFTATLFVVVNA